MSQRTRLRREDPARTEPIRNWSALYRSSGSWPASEAVGNGQPEAGSNTTASGDPVSDGVALGYRVVEEQIRKGKREAERLAQAANRGHPVDGDLSEVADRAWRYFTDLGSLWVEFVASLAGDGEVARKFSETLQASAARPGYEPATPNATGVVIAVSCDRPTEVRLDLRPGAEKAALACHPLRAFDEENPPLGDIAFERGADGAVTLRIGVPTEQPPGVYSGAVVDSATGQPSGTLSVRVPQQGPA